MVVALVGGFEGMRTIAYRDPVGIPTVCFGETRGVHMGAHYTPAECKGMLGAALPQYEAQMAGCLTHPEKVPDLSYGAFVSTTYNIGGGGFCKSSMARDTNAGNLISACNDLLKYDRAAGIVLPGLKKRREEERALCLEGAADGKVTF